MAELGGLLAEDVEVCLQVLCVRLELVDALEVVVSADDVVPGNVKRTAHRREPIRIPRTSQWSLAADQQAASGKRGRRIGRLIRRGKGGELHLLCLEAVEELTDELEALGGASVELLGLGAVLALAEVSERHQERVRGLLEDLLHVVAPLEAVVQVAGVHVEVAEDPQGEVGGVVLRPLKGGAHGIAACGGGDRERDPADGASEALAEGGLAQGAGIEGGGCGPDGTGARRDGSGPPGDGARGRSRGGHPCADHRDSLQQ